MGMHGNMFVCVCVWWYVNTVMVKSLVIFWCPGNIDMIVCVLCIFKIYPRVSWSVDVFTTFHAWLFMIICRLHSSLILNIGNSVPHECLTLLSFYCQRVRLSTGFHLLDIIPVTFCFLSTLAICNLVYIPGSCDLWCLQSIVRFFSPYLCLSIAVWYCHFSIVCMMIALFYSLGCGNVSY